MFICKNHIVEPNLLEYIRLHGVDSSCAFCGIHSKCLDTAYADVGNIFKAILRYNFDEVDYNGKFGGDYFTSLLMADDFIFDKNINDNDDANSDLDGELWDLGFYSENTISIHAGYGEDGFYNMPYMSIINSHHPFIDSLPKKLVTENYYSYEKDLREIIKNYNNSFAKIIECGSVVYRARVGTAGYKMAHKDYSRDGKKIFVPYKDKDIGSVPPLKATGGRANRVGVSYLYCATDSYTAIAEVRPHPTDIVSLGQFGVTRALKVFDFSHPNFLDFIQSDDSLSGLIPYAKMASVFNTATPPSLEGRYSVSQLISDCIRDEGYDGIQFSSTVSSGKNLVVFDSSDMQFVDGSSKVIEIDKVQYTYLDRQVVGMDDQWEYYYDEVE